MAEGVEFLLKRYPDYAVVDDLPLDTVQERVISLVVIAWLYFFSCANWHLCFLCCLCEYLVYFLLVCRHVCLFSCTQCRQHLLLLLLLLLLFLGPHAIWPLIGQCDRGQTQPGLIACYIRSQNGSSKPLVCGKSDCHIAECIHCKSGLA